MATREGRVSTFYSYKGGVGRSFLLANVSVTLAMWGHRVLCLDWDLEAPGLAHYFHDQLGAPVTRGVVELVEQVQSGGAFDWRSAVIPVQVAANATIDLIPAGAANDYERRVQDLDWQRIYADHDFGQMLERARAEMKGAYDSVLIDSRTGVSDIGGICAVQLPDVLFMILAANEQNLDGIDSIASRVRVARDELDVDRLALPIVPILSRFDAREERKLASEWQAKIARRLERHMSLWMPEGVKALEFVEQSAVPYVAYWSFGERLPVLHERSTDPESITWSIETVAAIVANGPDQVDELIESRDRFLSKARGTSAPEHVYDVFVSSGALDATRAVELAVALRQSGLLVYCPVELGAVGADWRIELDTSLSNSLNLVVLVEGSLRRDQTAEVRAFLGQLVDRTSDSRIVVVNLSTLRPELPAILLDRPVIPWTTVQQVNRQVIASLGMDASGIKRWSDIVSDREWLLGPYHAGTIATLDNLAKLLGKVGRYDEALRAAERVLIGREQTVGRLHADTIAARVEVTRHLRELGRYDEALAQVEDAVADGERVLGGEKPGESYPGYGGIDESAVREQVAIALLDKGVTLGRMGRREDEVRAYEEVVDRFGEVDGAAVRAQVAKARVNTGVAFAELGRYEDEVRMYDEVVDRYGDIDEPAMREAVARALVNKGVALGRSERHEEELRMYDQAIDRFGDLDEPAMRQEVARALVNKGMNLDQLERHEDELLVYDEIIDRYGDVDEPAVRQQVARSFINKGVTLGQLERYDEELLVYDEIIDRYGDVDEPGTREEVASALVYKGVALGRLERREEELRVYDEVVDRYGDVVESGVREQVSNALLDKGVALGWLERYDEELRMYDEVLERYRDDGELAVPENVAIALINRGIALGRLERREDEVGVYDEVVVRYADLDEPAVRAQVARAMLNKGIALGHLNRHEDEVRVYDDLIGRYGDLDESGVKDAVSKAKERRAASA